MKVICINGSPRPEGNTAVALREMAVELREQGIEVETIHVGNKPIRGCLACGTCIRKKNERCVINDDPVNEIIQKMKAADGVVLGSPVYYAGIAGIMKCFCDRAFYVSGANGGLFADKVGAAVVAARRSGGSAAWAGLNYYLTISKMQIAGSSYWNIVHGALAGEAEADAEGLQTVRNTAKQMAWLMKLKEAAKDVPAPEYDKGARTSFIR